MRRPCVFFGAALAAASASAVVAHLSGALLFYLAAAFAALLGLSVIFVRHKSRSALFLCLAGLSLGFFLTGIQDVTHRLPAEALAGEERTLALEVLSYPELTSSGRLYGYTVRLTEEKGLRAQFYTEDDSFIPGDLLSCPAEILRPASDGDFDFDRYLRAENIWLTLFAAEPPLRVGHRSSLRYVPLRLAEDIRHRLTEALPGDTGGILTGVMLSGRSNLSDTLSDAASTSGVSHMFAVSGMHLAVLASVVLFFFRSRYSVFLLIPLCGFFAVMTGLSPSVLRAAFVLILPLLAPWFSREGDRLNTLFFALTVLLFTNPARIASLSLLYSFGAMLGLILYGGRLGAFFARLVDRLPRVLRPVGNFLASGTAAYLAASLFTLPITALAFGHLPLLGLVANLALVWMLPFLFIGGYLLYFLLLLFPAAGNAVAGFLSPLLSAVADIVLFFGRGNAALGLGTPLFIGWFLLSYAGLLLCLVLPSRRPTLLWSTLVCGGLCAVLLITSFSSATSVTVDWLDVGSGQCVLLRDGKSSILLDCGGNRAADLAATALLAENRPAVDVLILSHTDSDHAGGAAELMAAGKIRHLILSDYAATEPEGIVLLDTAANAGIPVTLLSEDMCLQLPSGTLTLFAADWEAEQPCITALYSAHDTDIFFAADIAFAEEQQFLWRGVLPDLELLSVAHHGSRYSTSAAFLAVVQPEEAVISVGENSYGHPHPDTLTRLTNAGVTVHTTLQEGSLRLRLRAGGYTLSALH